MLNPNIPRSLTRVLEEGGSFGDGFPCHIQNFGERPNCVCVSTNHTDNNARTLRAGPYLGFLKGTTVAFMKGSQFQDKDEDDASLWAYESKDGDKIAIRSARFDQLMNRWELGNLVNCSLSCFDTKNNCEYEWLGFDTDEMATVAVRTTTNVKPGEEFLVSYGSKANKQVDEEVIKKPFIYIMYLLHIHIIPNVCIHYIYLAFCIIRSSSVRST
jgi:hypothetical protein